MFLLEQKKTSHIKWYNNKKQVDNKSICYVLSISILNVDYLISDVKHKKSTHTQKEDLH